MRHDLVPAEDQYCRWKNVQEGTGDLHEFCNFPRALIKKMIAQPENRLLQDFVNRQFWS